ncbi:hypothetical protein [Microbispora hainanensis]|uniref:hypothetical protein n=1 Tax=Microbispora hainanensis TaxID=568844 RepID=UPI001FCB00C7|nr:hypothetical protein [Microbispora hainanensis]
MAEDQTHFRQVDLECSVRVILPSGEDFDGPANTVHDRGIERPDPGVRDADISGLDQCENLLAAVVIAQEMSGVGPPYLPAGCFGEEQIPFEPLEKRKQVGVSCGSGRREKKRVGSSDFFDGPADGAVA